MTKKRNIAIGVGVVAGLGGLAYYMSKRAGAWEPPPDSEPIPGWTPPTNGEPTNGEPTNGGPPKEDGWSENVIVEDISVKPSLAYFGETVQIECYIQYLHPAPLPATITGTVLVNGTKIVRSFQLDFRNPTLSFPYTPTRSGEFIVRAQDKSASFEVVEHSVGAIYCPWGGIKMPRPVKWHASDGKVYDYSLGSDAFNVTLESGQTADDAAKSGYPEWASGVHVGLWVAYVSTRRSRRTRISDSAWIHVVPLRWTGQVPYWNSKDELATDLIRGGSNRGIELNKDGEPTKPYVFNLTKGLAFWTKGFDMRSTYGGEFQRILGCPHCSHEVLGPLQYIGHDWLPIMRRMIEHIEDRHPKYLSQPSYGELSYGVCDWCNGTGKAPKAPMFPCVSCGGRGERWYRTHVWGLPEF